MRDNEPYFFCEKISDIFFKKKFRGEHRKSLRKSIFHRNFKIFEKNENFRFFKKIDFFLRICNQTKNHLGKNVHLGFFFEEKQSRFLCAKNFQVDITSSDLNEFLIGQKILEAETFLLNLSTTFMGLGGAKCSASTKIGRTLFFFPKLAESGTSLFPRIKCYRKVCRSPSQPAVPIQDYRILQNTLFGTQTIYLGFVNLRGVGLDTSTATRGSDGGVHGLRHHCSWH